MYNLFWVQLSVQSFVWLLITCEYYKMPQVTSANVLLFPKLYFSEQKRKTQNH